MLRVLVTIGGLQLAAMISILLRTKGLAYLLGPADLGVMAVIDKLVAMVSQTASLSLPFAATRFLPALHDERAAFLRLRRAMTLVVLGSTTLAALAALLVFWLRPEVVGLELAGHRPWVALALVTVPIVAFAAFLPSAIAGGLDHRGAMTFTLAHAVALSVSGLAGAWVGGVAGLYVAYTVLGGVLVVTRLRRVLKAVSAGSGPWLPLPVWRFAGAMLALAWVVPYAALFTHYQVLRHLGPDSAGYLQAAMGLALAVRTVLGSGHALFLTPNVNRSGSTADRFAWVVQYQRTLALLAGLLVPPLMLGIDLAVRLLYSPAFLPAAPAVWPFVLAEVLTLFAGTYQSLILASDHLRYHVFQNLLAQLVTVVAAYLAVPTIGIVGAALSTIAAQAIIWATTLHFVHSRLGQRLPAATGWLTLVSTASVSLAGIAGAVLPWTPAGVGWRLAAWALGLGLLASTTNPDERRRATAVWRLGPRGWAAHARSLTTR